VGLTEGIVGAVLGVDGWRDDEGGRVGRRVVVATRFPSTGRTGIGGGRPDRLVHCRRKITDGAVVLVGGEPTCDMNPSEQPLAGEIWASVVVVACPFASTKRRARRREEVVEHERL